MSFKFVLPKLDTLLLKDLKADSNDPRKFIHVMNGHAVVQNNVIVIVDLREYVKTECELYDEKELEDLTDIIDWMEGKSFPADYWAELTKEHLINRIEKGLEISTLNYSKVLIYEDPEVSLELIADILASNLNKDSMAVPRIAINADLVAKITSVFKKELKGLSLIFEFTGQDCAARFQASKKDYIFGIIPTNYNDSVEIYNFQSIKNYHGLICNSILE